MQAANLVLLTWVALAFFVTTSANEDRLLSEKNRSNSGGLPLQISIDTGYLTTTESEERWGLNSIASKIKGLFSKNKNLSNKLSSTRLKPNVAASAEKIPSVKKVATAMENDPTVIQKLNDNPGVFKELANDPQVVKTTATLQKNDILSRVLSSSFVLRRLTNPSNEANWMLLTRYWVWGLRLCLL
ncbi:unnamed protein product [Phytophthora fragariaefolia]|uniref:Unnamed protein product n=1 Tax=Phytophthora fragariaefolia TaxID=1490495 RepID=A0A9W6YJJ8_9STRA|nr:unnamed protein product [Phytophthora fragariaefolia]